MIFFSVGSGRLEIHEILIGIFVTATTPVTLMMLARAALYRDRVENDERAPPKQIDHVAARKQGSNGET